MSLVVKEGEVADAVVTRHTVLAELVRSALREDPDLVSIALGDHQGLPIASATRGKLPAMTFTAMATMSLQAARTAASAVGLEEPEHMIVHSESGDLIILRVRGKLTCLISLLRPNGNLGYSLVVLRRLADQINAALG